MAVKTEIDLLHIGGQLALSAKGLQKKVEETNRPLAIPASMLAAKIPELKALGEIKVFQLRKNDKEFKINTLTVFKNPDEDGCGVYSPDLELVNEFEIVKYKTGLSGWTVLKHKSGLELKAAISCNTDHVMELEETDQQGIEGEGDPPVDALRDLPQPETPLWSPVLPLNEEITVLSNGKLSKEHKTPLVDVKLKNGDLQKNVICNATLQRMHEKHGNGMQFKIAKKKQVKRKEDGKDVWVVDIIDCQLDLSDL